MEISERREGRVVVLRPVGNIDTDTTPAFESQLVARVAEGAAVLVDFSDVEFISSRGLAALMKAAKQAKAQSTRIGVAALRPVVQEIFTISRFAHVVPVYGTAAEGATALQ